MSPKKAIGNREQVLRGDKDRTSGGLMKSRLLPWRGGRIVSKKELAKFRRHGKRNLTRWTVAVACARKVLGITGFGKLRKESELYKKVKAYKDKPSWVWGWKEAVEILGEDHKLVSFLFVCEEGGSDVPGESDREGMSR